MHVKLTFFSCQTLGGIYLVGTDTFFPELSIVLVLQYYTTTSPQLVRIAVVMNELQI